MSTSENTLVATEPLFIGRYRAHNAGDVVPAENVERHGWSAKVAPATTTAAVEATGTPIPQAIADLRGPALDEALERAGQPKTGTADEKRARLATAQPL